MPVNQFQMQLALRAKLVSLSVISSGSISLSASGKIFTRSTGSFLTDGFAAGMEILSAGFAAGGNNDYATIVQATALTLTVNRTLVTEGAGSGRSLSVGLPSRRAWENDEFTPDSGNPWIEEAFIPAGTRQETCSAGGKMMAFAIYNIKVHVPLDVGIGAITRYCDALEGLFAPRTTMTLTNGDALRVRTDTGPYRGQLMQMKPGWATVPVSIPLWIYTTNP